MNKFSKICHILLIIVMFTVMLTTFTLVVCACLAAKKVETKLYKRVIEMNLEESSEENFMNDSIESSNIIIISPEAARQQFAGEVPNTISYWTDKKDEIVFNYKEIDSAGNYVFEKDVQ